MADKKTGEGEKPAKRSKMPLILGLVLALAGAGGGFYAVWSGLILGRESQSGVATRKVDDHAAIGAMPDIAYVPVEPLVISLGDGASGKHLRFRAQLEVAPDHLAEVEKLMPRVVDVLNSYLRALAIGDLTDKAALTRLRAQMLRRLQVVTGEGRINDLLIMEFVLN
ncbi:flagellar basal body-associated FliL family protein [Roseovarius sp. Pro17]|uniref:flagellar basal body-associated FliL family protein n=1 Tax=Roseovarius sp. Pro17 TaxID=3108175 RepID=UPI002D7806C9|nr:flagellar basal body-associated FliL family protein [Roseovarius sp. Pro17]